MSPLPQWALSIRQPWAWLICHAGKDIENRTWNTKYRGPLLIHAGKKWGPEERDDRLEIMSRFGIDIPEQLELGGIVGQARLVDCVESHASRWFCGPYGMVLADAAPLSFQPCAGSLGFFQPKLKTMEKL